VKYSTAVPVGQGASGEVLKAWDPHLERFVALKLLRSDDPAQVARMQREARLQAKLSHPNIADVYEVGELDGRPYIAMQLVEGLPLDQALGIEPLERRVRVLATIARAVHAAHEEGLVHRDLKPGNLLVERDGEGALVPYVLDFGIAREEAAAGQTETGQMIGTPGYLSPEQARGETTRLDRRSDVFALGVVIYEVVTGARAFAAASAVESLLLVLDGEPPRPRSVVPSLPRDLETVVLKCLEKDPARRYGSARELADDLERFLRGEPVTARATGRLERLLLRARRHPAATAAIASVALALLALGGTAVQARRGAAERAAAAQRFGERVARVESWMRFAQLAPLHDRRPDVRRVGVEMERLREEIGELGEPARAVGLYALGRAHLALDEGDRAVPLLEEGWGAGHRTPEAALALGRAYAGLLRAELQAISRLAEPETRQARLRRAQATLRDPARRYLVAARGAEGVPASYVAGLLALVEGDHRKALAMAQAVTAELSWLHEGWALAGDVWLAEAQAAFWKPDLAAAGRAVEAADAAYARAVAVGRSDAAAHAARCAAANLGLDVALESGATPEPRLLDPVRTACAPVRVIDAGDVRGQELLARAHWRLAQFQMRRGRDPLPLLAEAVRLAEDGLAARSSHPGLAHQLGMAHQVAGTHLGQLLAPEAAARLDAAVAALSLAARVRPGDGELWKALGDTYQRRANYLLNHDGDALPDLLAARDAYRRAADTPDFPAERLLSSRGNLATETAMARLLRGQDAAPDLAEALELLGRARTELPWQASADNNLGLAYWTRARWEEVRGGDPTPWYERAYASYGAVLAREPDRTSSRVPMVAAAADHLRWLLRQGRGVDVVLASSERHLARLPDSEALDRAYFRADLENVRARDLMRRGGDPAAALRRAEAAGHEYLRLSEGDAWGFVPVAETFRIRAERALAAEDCRTASAAATAGLALAEQATEANPRLVVALVHRAALQHALSQCTAGPGGEERAAQARASLAAALALQPVLADPLREQLGVSPREVAAPRPVASGTR
jgi:hypothetical protein